MQKNVTHYCLLWKIKKIIISLIKWSYVIGDVRPYHTALRAIHLVLLGKLKSEAFLWCLKRFYAPRREAKGIYSNNDANFVILQLNFN